MQIKLKKTLTLKPGENLALVVEGVAGLPNTLLNKAEMNFLKHQHEDLKKEIVIIDRMSHIVVVCFTNKELKTRDAQLEAFRVAGDKVAQKLNDNKVKSLGVTGADTMGAETLAFIEGVALGNYQFLQYKTRTDGKKNTLVSLAVVHKGIDANALKTIELTTDAVFRCRDLVNEPVINLGAEALAGVFHDMAKEAGITVEILNKARIEALKMGGLLAVNKGSVDPPTFTVMEYKPSGKINRKPYVLVGKGVVYDTGGMSLKPSASMIDMKSDMAGAAAAASTVFAIAKAKLPVWIIALMPATDNRPTGNAQVPGDVIRMYDGTTVEVLNTDAEGRLILADALAYAKKYKPELVIDIATLTGAAQAAVGGYATVAMQSGADKPLEQLKTSGFRVHERIAELPFWDDYKELIKSDVADLKNIGGVYAGAITAGKFLESFTSYPYIHLDIAGPAFTDKRDSYRGLGGTGTGIRLLFDFFSTLVQKSKG